MAQLLGGLATTLLGGVAGGLSNTTAARTSTSNQTYGTSNSGSSTPTFNPMQTGLQGTILQNLNKTLNGGVDTTPMATAGTDAINKTYKSIGDRLNESLSARGFGNSGASGTAALQTELGRAGAIGDLQSQLQTYALQQQQDALGKALQFAFAAPGSTYTGSTSGNSYGTSVGPGSVAGGIFGGAGTSLLNQLAAAANNKSGTSLWGSLFG